MYSDKFQHYLADRHRGLLVLLVMALGAVYLPFLGNPFFFDDLNFFTTGAAAAYADRGFDFGLRWFPYALLGRLYGVFSDELPHVYHLMSAVIHAANAILLFFLLLRLGEAVDVGRGGMAWPARNAWFGALVFALHPVAVYAAGYAIQITILMATTFALLMLLAYLRGLKTGQSRWFALAVAAYFLACFSKEHSVLMPAVLAAMGLLVSGQVRVSRHVLWATWGAFFAIAVLITLRAKGVLGSPYEAMAAQLFEQQGIEGSIPMLHWLSALTQAGLFFKYLLLWVVPDTALMSIDMREPFVASPWGWQAWVGGAAFLLYGAVSLRLLLRRGVAGLVGFALLYPWLLFCVEMTGIRVQEPFVLYRSYLWVPGLMLLVPLLLARLPERRAVLVMVCVALVLVPLSWGRLRVFSDNYRLWDEAAGLLKNDSVAGADRILYNRGQAELAARKWEEAAADFRRAANISPQLAPIHYELGIAYGNLKRFDDALAQFDMAIALNPQDASSYFAKAILLKNMGRDVEAKRAMRASCELKNQLACLISSGSTAIGSPGLQH